MKIGIYTPFPPTFGGGERYCLTIAELLSRKNEVYFISQYEYDLTTLSNTFNLDLKKVNFLKKDGARHFFLPPITKQYDLFICLSNHMTPPVFSWGQRGFLVVQFPFPYPQKKIGDKIQLFLKNFKCASYDLIICYSNFVKKWIKKTGVFNKEIIVLSPPIDTSYLLSTRKKDRILSVGRFFRGNHEKKHFEMIDVFKKIIDSRFSKWTYHLAGGVSHYNYFEEMKKAISGYEIFLHPNISGEKLRALYGEAKIFWHAAGFGENQKEAPWKSEHFGMAVLEAMSAGCVPVVANKGALPEFVEHGKNGFLFDDLEGLEKWTVKLIKDEELRKKLSKEAVATAKRFDKRVFEKRLKRIVKEMMEKSR